MEKKEAKRICSRCDVPLELIEANFSYLGRSFRHPVPRCPVCGQVFIDEELAKGKMSMIESNFEDK